MSVKATIFDLDGTLLDTLADLRESLVLALGEFGLPVWFDADTFKLMVGNGSVALIKRALGSGLQDDEQLVAELRKSYLSAYEKRLFHLTRPYPGVPELLGRLKARGFKMGVWSNKDDIFAKPLIDEFFPGLFAKVMGAAPERPPKPDPQAGLELAAFLGASPERLFYLGDSEVDMETAKNCGFIALGVAWGFRSDKDLSSAGADAILYFPEDFFQYLSLGN
ncbi:MAG: HAD-IA family hydrolase [Deltaproteobacteria bacterium]|nr:HAD-IA family hydrolase [Deltaproteobacteria bacterium]